MQPIDDKQVFGLPLNGVVQRTGVEVDGMTIPRYVCPALCRAKEMCDRCQGRAGPWTGWISLKIFLRRKVQETDR